MEPTLVRDEEWLYRSIRANADEFKVVEGRPRFSTNAFKAADKKPSVDRSGLRADPRDARLDPSDGIAKFSAGEVRQIAGIRTNPNDKENVRTYDVDAIHRPLLVSRGADKDNFAHCQVESSPEMLVSNHVKRLKEALAILADKYGWVVGPNSG